MKFMFKKKVFFSLFSFILIALILYFVFPSKHDISPIGTVLTEKSMLEDLKVLGGKELKVKYIDIAFNARIPEFTIKSSNGSIDKNSRIISVTSTNKKLMKITKPYNVYQAMRTWLYLKDRKPPFDIVGVNGGFQQKWVMSKLQWALVTKTEFDQIYNKVFKPELSEEELIRLMSEMWITQTNYEKMVGR